MNHKDLSLERIIFFSDAVFAIAITILALEIQLPGDTAEPVRMIRELAPALLAYVFGFTQIAIYWLAHHTLFEKLVRYDTTLIGLNLLFLLLIAFLPVPVSILIRSGVQLGSLAFMYGCLVMLGGVEWLLWKYLASPRRSLLDESLTARERSIIKRKIEALILLFLVGIVVAYIQPLVALLVSGAVPLIHRRIERRGHDPRAGYPVARDGIFD